MFIPGPVAKEWSEIQDKVPFSQDDLLADVGKLRSRHRLHAVFIGGSKVEGYANARSDLDVYALVEHADRRDHVGYDVSFVNGQVIQYDFISVAWVEEVIQQLESKSHEDVVVSRDGIKVLHRLCNSVVVDGHALVGDLRSRLMSNGFVRLCADRKAMECENGLQDAYGAIESGHLETAIATLRNATQRALDSLLAVHGETVNHDKWIFPRSLRAFGPTHPVSIRFRELYNEVPSVADPAQVDRYVQSSLQFIQVCLEGVCAYDLSPGEGRRSESPLSAAVLRGLASAPNASKSAHVFLKTVGGKVTLYHRARPRQQISDRAAAIWLGMGTGGPAEGAAIALKARPDIYADFDEASALASRLEAAWRATGFVS